MPHSQSPGLLERRGAAHIRILPFELIAEAFKLGRNMVTEFPDDTVYLLLITSVCSVWRSVALSVPELWTNIQSKWWFKKSTRKVNLAKERLEAYIARSKSASLDISLNFLGSLARWDVPLAYTEKFLCNRIFPHLHRCRSLVLYLSEHIKVNTFLPLPGSMERLRRFDFAFCSVGGTGPEVPLASSKNMAL